MSLSPESVEILLTLLNQTTLSVAAPDFEETAGRLATAKRELLELGSEVTDA